MTFRMTKTECLYYATVHGLCPANVPQEKMDGNLYIFADKKGNTVSAMTFQTAINCWKKRFDS